MVLFALLISFTLGSFGSEGRSFIEDLAQADAANLGWVLLGGIIFNASNILLSAATSIAGMAVAIICNGLASGRMSAGNDSGRDSRKGIMLAVCAGVLMSFFYRFVAKAMDIDNFAMPAAGKVTPYTAIFIFSIGVLLSNFIFNTFVMKKPFVGKPVPFRDYFKGSARTHLVGMLGGAIWCLGTAFSYIASGQAGAAVSYALGQGAPMIAAAWGVFVWKEFKGSDKKTNALLTLMFVFFIAGLASIVISGGN